MGERGIDRVQVALSRQTISIPWESRQSLLERLQGVESMRDVVGTFWAVGTSRPVELTPEQGRPRRRDRSLGGRGRRLLGAA